jgi:hypothetical protein
MKKIIFLLSLLSTSAFATQTFECVFTNFSDQRGNHKETLKLTFLIDKGAEKYYMVGNNGSNPVVYFDRGNGISFVEVTGSGNIMSTTIDTKMNAVHSRNSVGILGELLPSQFYGSCIAK